MAYLQTVKMVTGDTLPEVTVNLKDSSTAASGQVLDENNSDTWAPIPLSCLLYTSPSPRDRTRSRMPSSA